MALVRLQHSPLYETVRKLLQDGTELLLLDIQRCNNAVNANGKETREKNSHPFKITSKVHYVSNSRPIGNKEQIKFLSPNKGYFP